MMSYQEIYDKTNEEYRERLELVMERISGIAAEDGKSVGEVYRGYFAELSGLFLTLRRLTDNALQGKLAQVSEAEGEAWNRSLFCRCAGGGV